MIVAVELKTKSQSRPSKTFLKLKEFRANLGGIGSRNKVTQGN